MDFRFTPEAQQIQQEAIEFTRREWEPGKWDTQILVNWHHQVDEAEEAINEFEKKLVNKGWWTMHWPSEFGGQDASIEVQLAYREAMSYAGAPASLGGGLVAPVLMLAAPKWMQDEFLPGIASADLEFSQGFSEPDAGSDLGSLKTRAVRDGDDYLISGQKIWGTYRNPWIHIPAGYYRTMRSSSLIREFETEPEPELHDRVIRWPRGRVLGGSGAVNGPSRATICRPRQT